MNLRKKALAILLSFTLSVIFSLTVFAQNGVDDNQISADDIFGKSCFLIDDFSVTEGQTKSVALSICNNIGIKSATVEIITDSNIQLNGISLENGILGEGVINGNIISWELSKAVAQDGLAATVTFKGISEADAIINVNILSVTDADGDQTEIFENTVTKVEIIKNAVIYGDVNGDGIVDSKDLVRLKKKLAGQAVEYNEANSDCNGDNSIDTKDLVRLKKKLAGQDVILGPL